METAPAAIKDKNSVTGTITDDISITALHDNAYVDEDNFNPAISNTSLIGKVHATTGAGLDATGNGTTGADTKLGITSSLANARYELNFANSITLNSDTQTDSAVGTAGIADFKSGGTQILYDVVGNTISAYTDGTNATTKANTKVFEIVLSNNTNSDGYTYTQYKNIDHPTGTADVNATNTTADDTLSLKFGFTIKDLNGAGAADDATSAIQYFNVVVNDSLPQSENQTITAVEDTNKVIVLSEESFNGSINLDNGVDAASDVAVGGTLNIYDANGTTVVGKITVNNNGTVTFTTSNGGTDTHYSGTTKGFSYTGISDYDGDKASASVAISVLPKSDAPTLTPLTAVTFEDTAIQVNLKAPIVTDNVDVNGVSTSDYPERLGAITLSGVSNRCRALLYGWRNQSSCCSNK